MNTKRVIAAAAVVALAGVGGMFALAPELHGQSASQSKNRSKRRRHAFVLAAQDHGPLVAFAGSGPRIGVRVRDVEPSDVTKQKLAGQAGAVIEQVDSETPAAKAGLKAGDVVVGVRRRTRPERASARSAGGGNAAGTQREDVDRARYREARCRRHARGLVSSPARCRGCATTPKTASASSATSTPAG